MTSDLSSFQIWRNNRARSRGYRNDPKYRDGTHVIVFRSPPPAYLLTAKEILSKPRCSADAGAGGVYFLINDEEITYVGQSENIPLRVRSHRRREHNHPFERWTYIETPKDVRSLIEQYYIALLIPAHNKTFAIYDPTAEPKDAGVAFPGLALLQNAYEIALNQVDLDPAVLKWFEEGPLFWDYGEDTEVPDQLSRAA